MYVSNKLIRFASYKFNHNNYYNYESKSLHCLREKAISIAANHNCVTKDVAERYSDSELKEVLKQLKLKANF